MKKVIIHFFHEKSNQEGFLKEWFIVQDVIIELYTIKARVLCIDGVERTLDYSIAEFEYAWKINLGELPIPIPIALAVAKELQS